MNPNLDSMSLKMQNEQQGLKISLSSKWSVLPENCLSIF